MCERMETMANVKATQPRSAACIAWLQGVLVERFALPIELRQEGRSWQLSLSGQESVIRIRCDTATYTRADSDLPFTIWRAEHEGWKPILGQPLPAPGAASLPVPLVEQTADGCVVHYDILGLAYWMLTRQEEVGRTDLDEHGRFPATSSHAGKYGYLERPIVDEWLDILGQIIQRVWPSAELKPNVFEMKVSHDVDRAARYGFIPWRSMPRRILGDLLKRRDPHGLLAPWIRLNTLMHLHPWDAFNTFDWLMDVSERSGLKSAFYFICDRRGTAYDSNYDLEHPAIRTLIRNIHARGHEVGLHPSYGTYRDPKQIRHELDHLQAVCCQEGVHQNTWGGRMHYLQWEQSGTLRAWDSAGLTYDGSMTYADYVGFRCGTCFDYQAFDPVARKALRLRIRPLVVMEGSVFGDNYMNFDANNEACAKMLALKAVCRQVAGTFTLLWHNSSLQTSTEQAIYKAVVEG